jgi:hypothetical protein
MLPLEMLADAEKAEVYPNLEEPAHGSEKFAFTFGRRGRRRERSPTRSKKAFASVVIDGRLMVGD